MKNCPQVAAPYAFSPSSLTICSSERKKNEVCGLMSRSAWPFAVFSGAIAKPFDPAGSRGSAPSAASRACSTASATAT